MGPEYPNNKNTQIVLPELSYKIVGSAFTVFNSVGYGMSERHYQKLLATEFGFQRIPFEMEKQIDFLYHGQHVGKYFADFVVDQKVIVELKVRPKLGYSHVQQVMGYLRNTGYKLAILIYFTREGVKCRRVLNARVAE